MSHHRCEFCGRKIKLHYHKVSYRCKDCKTYVYYSDTSLMKISRMQFMTDEANLDIDFCKKTSVLYTGNNWSRELYRANSILAITPQDARAKIKTLLAFL